MSVVNLKKLREIAIKAKETHMIDLGKFIDKNLSGVVIPIRVKSIEETIKLKEGFEHRKIDGEKLSIKWQPYNRIPKSLKDMYTKEGLYRKGVTETTYFQIIEVDKDIQKLERRKYRERLFNILIHLDMEYINEEEQNMWETAGLEVGDYNGLIDLFSGIIKFDNHLDILDIVIDQLKAGTIDEDIINAHIINHNLRKAIDSIEDEDERKVFVQNLQKAIEKGQAETNALIESKEELEKEEIKEEVK